MGWYMAAALVLVGWLLFRVAALGYARLLFGGRARLRPEDEIWILTLALCLVSLFGLVLLLGDDTTLSKVGIISVVGGFCGVGVVLRVAGAVLGWDRLREGLEGIFNWPSEEDEEEAERKEPDACKPSGSADSVGEEKRETP